MKNWELFLIAMLLILTAGISGCVEKRPPQTPTNVDGRINEYIRSFGEDDQGEQYILTSEMGGPTGDTGKIYKMVLPAE